MERSRSEVGRLASIDTSATNEAAKRWDRVEERLRVGEERLRAGYKVRLQIRIGQSGTAILLGVAFCVLWSQTGVELPCFLSDFPDFAPFLWLMTDGLADLLILLAPLPDDKRMTILVLIIFFLKMVCYVWQDARELLACGKPESYGRAGGACPGALAGSREGCYAVRVSYVVSDLLFGLSAGVLACLGTRGMSTTRLQDRMWCMAAISWEVEGVVGLAMLLLTLVLGKVLDMTILAMLTAFIFAGLCRSKRVHEWFHERFQRIYSRRSELHAAAGVAGLVGDCSVQEALAEAKQRFRCVSVEKILPEALLSNSTAVGLNELAEPARLGECDAFLSHSWHDEPAAKWQALQQWRSSFAERVGREPRVWLDKYCVDQTNVESDLRSLPVFLSGCKELVLLVGPSYLRRLWCVVELFTFVHMGGNIGRIKLVPVLREGQESDDRRLIQKEFEAFGAEECDCFNPQDKEKMLSIIRSAFGSMDKFNESVREILVETGYVQSGEAGLIFREASDGSSPSTSSDSTDEESDSDREDARLCCRFC